MEQTRRGMLGALLCGPAVVLTHHGENTGRPEAAGSKAAVHEWQQGNFWVLTAANNEEPKFYPPTALVQLDYCTDCGILRLPEQYFSASPVSRNQAS